LHSPGWRKVTAEIEGLNYLDVLFTSEDKMEWEIYRWFDAPDCVNKGTEPKGKALDLPVHLHSDPHL